eukprot:15485861-Alexandrium_andersonii.AAC.1
MENLPPGTDPALAAGYLGGEEWTAPEEEADISCDAAIAAALAGGSPASQRLQGDGAPPDAPPAAKASGAVAG